MVFGQGDVQQHSEGGGCVKAGARGRKKREKYEEFLRSVKVLGSVEPYELTKIVDAVKPVEYKQGTLIIKEVSVLLTRRENKATSSSC